MVEGVYIFNPSTVERETLEKIFVGKERKRILDKIVRDLLKGAKIKSPRYYLIIGPRGIGKTHFVTLLYYRLLENSEEIIPVKLAEEEYSIFTLADFLLRVLETLGDTEAIEQLQELSDDKIAIQATEILKEKGKMLVVILENLNQILEEQMNEEEVKKFRAFLQNTNFMSLVSTAPSIFPSVSKHSAPFFNFFHIIHLHELSRDEVWELLQKLAEIEGVPALLERTREPMSSVDAVIRITGGNPRAVMLIYDVLSRDEVTHAEDILFRILDESTPYYQSIYAALDGKKRKVLDALAFLGRPATPKKIALKTRMDERSVATYLRRLERDGYVISKRAGRNTYYSIRDTLFRLWRELRLNPSKKRMVSIFIEFLQVWYTPEECLKKLSSLLTEKRLDGKRAKEIAYLFFSLPKEHKKMVVEPVVKKLLEAGFVEIIEENIEDMEVKEQALFVEFTELLNTKEYEKIIKKADQYIRKNENTAIPWLFKAAALDELGMKEETEKVLKDALERFGDNWVVVLALGFFYMQNNRVSEALGLFEKVIEMVPDLPVGWTFKGKALLLMERHSEAIGALNEAISRAGSEIGELYADRARCYFELGEYEEALKDARHALEIESNNAEAFKVLLLSLLELERYKEALSLLESHLQRYPDDWTAWRIKIGLLGLAERSEDAIKTADELATASPSVPDVWLIRLEAYLAAALGALIEERLGDVRSYLSTAVECIKEVLKRDNNAIKEVARNVSGFLKNIVEYGNLSTLKIVLEFLTPVGELKQILEPFEVAVYVIETGDEREYLKLNPESRRIAEEIVKKLTRGDR